jgi:hypothetical protein
VDPGVTGVASSEGGPQVGGPRPRPALLRVENVVGRPSSRSALDAPGVAIACNASRFCSSTAAITSNVSKSADDTWRETPSLGRRT